MDQSMKVLLANILLFVTIFTSSASQAIAADRSGMRGQRYGEVMLGRGGLLSPSEMDVYNTIGLNDCPQELWSKLDPEKIKQETGAKMVHLNGPRYWVIDGLTGSSLVNKEQRNFGGIPMREAGILELSLADKMSLGKPYMIHKVARQTVWIYDAGKPVFQLIGPDGAVYFMQSYSLEKGNQTMDSLSILGSKLQLPKGWSFRTLVLKNNFELPAIDGMAYVVQDDFANTYQKSTAKAADNL